jgi:hypothetical protein
MLGGVAEVVLSRRRRQVVLTEEQRQQRVEPLARVNAKRKARLQSEQSGLKPHARPKGGGMPG